MMQIAAPNEFDPVAVQFEFNAVPVVNVVVSSVNSMWNDDPEFVPVHGEFDDKLMLLGLFGEIHANAIPPTDADDGVIDGPVPGVVVPLDVTGAPPSNWLVPNVDKSTPDSSYATMLKNEFDDVNAHDVPSPDCTARSTRATPPPDELPMLNSCVHPVGFPMVEASLHPIMNIR